MDLLKTYNYIPNDSVINARNNISFNLNEILLYPATSTTAQIEVIQKYANDYGLQDYVKNKIAGILRYNDNVIFKNLMKKFDAIKKMIELGTL